MEAVHGKYCGKFALTGRRFSEGGQSFVLPKGSKYYEPLRRATLQLRDEGYIDSIDSFFEKKGKCDISGSPRVSFTRLKTFFILAFAAFALLLLYMILDPQTDPGTTLTRDGKKEVSLPLSVTLKEDLSSTNV